MSERDFDTTNCESPDQDLTFQRFDQFLDRPFISPDANSGLGRDEFFDPSFGGNDRTVVATSEELADFGVAGVRGGSLSRCF